MKSDLIRLAAALGRDGHDDIVKALGRIVDTAGPDPSPSYVILRLVGSTDLTWGYVVEVICEAPSSPQDLSG